MTTVWFVRHGQSTSNAGEVTKSPDSIPLTALGQQQADAVAEIFPIKPNLLVTSKFVRTQLTAQPTVVRFADVVQTQWPVFEFSYLPPESYDGTTWQERMPMAAEYWERADPHERANERSESYAMMFERVADALNRVDESSAEFIIVFSHGIFMKAIIWYLLHNGNHEKCLETMTAFSHFFRAVEVPNTGVLKLEFSAESSLPVMYPVVSDHLP